jgi:NAD(P)H-hydrate epimerase
VVALDIPTGLHGDSGVVMGFAVRADITVTFVGLKTGLFLGDGPAWSGDVVFADLGVPDNCRRSSQARFRRIDDDALQSALSPRRRTAHKGDFGHVLVIGGGAGMPGAVRLCGEAALRTGSGRVSIATDPAHAAIIVASRPELMSYGVSSGADLEPLLDNANVVAIGPGLGQSEWAQQLVAIIAESDKQSVWDADALTLLADSPVTDDNRVITPHPGEAATLLGCTIAEVQADRRAALRQLQEQYGGVVVLKGSGSLVSSATGLPWLCCSGNPGMAAPGMGDVLTGIIAALIAQGFTVEDAAAIGVEVHARAGDRAAESGERGLAASDLFAELRRVINP